MCEDLLKFNLSIRMGNKGDLGDFDCGTVVGAGPHHIPHALLDGVVAFFSIWGSMKRLFALSFTIMDEQATSNHLENYPNNVIRHCWCQYSYCVGITIKMSENNYLLHFFIANFFL